MKKFAGGLSQQLASGGGSNRKKAPTSGLKIESKRQSVGESNNSITGSSSRYSNNHTANDMEEPFSPSMIEFEEEKRHHRYGNKERLSSSSDHDHRGGDDIFDQYSSNNIGSNRIDHSFLPTRSSSPPMPLFNDRKSFHSENIEYNINGDDYSQEVSSPQPRKSESSIVDHEISRSPGESLGSAFKKLKTKKKNLSFSKFSENVKNFKIMNKSALEDYTSDIERGHTQLLDACDEFFEKRESAEIAICKSSDILNLFGNEVTERNVIFILEKIEACHWEYGYHLLAVVMGYASNANSVTGGFANSKKNCSTVLDCNGLGTIIYAFKHHAFALANIEVSHSIPTEQLEKMCKEKEKWFNLYANILYVFLTVLSWSPSKEVLDELKYDLFDRNVNESRTQYGKKENSEHFFIVLLTLLRKSVLSDATDRANIHSLKKLVMLMHKTLHILFICDADNSHKKKYTKITKVLQKERSKSMRLKVAQEMKEAYIKVNQGNASKIVEEAIDVYQKAPEKKDTSEKVTDSSIPRALIENPSMKEVLYRLLLEELPDFVVLMLSILDKITKGECGVNFSTVEKRRYCNILLKSLLSVVLLLIKNWRKSCLMQAKYLIHLLGEAEIYVLLFRLIELDIKAFVYHDDTNAEVFFMRGEPSIKTNASFSTKPNWRNIYVVTIALRIIHQMTKDDPFLISKLIRKNKLHRTLKKVIQAEDIEALCKYSYTSWIQSLNTTIQISQTEYVNEMKRVLHDIEHFHNVNYFGWWKHIGYRAIDKLAKTKRQANSQQQDYDQLVFSKDNGSLGEDYISYLYNSIELTEEEKRRALLLQI
ncbi:hypothetical protein C9374_013110 [Naegleria lovaniensis]|uniref:Uncharacterized protein n=1 Tax=Naegleria lovaniensis TaxID=51637 RepID=A0AA88KB57_NAELO|nr:uncharacterized protein C9374_013110 [Naegleria lovaniensis]KAG2372830.1 hypothetical protein C9374_013110 [Naegleria lovaniensis]